MYQYQFHLYIQVNHLAIGPEGFHLYLFQFILLAILHLYHHKYHVWIHAELKVNNRLGIYKNKGAQHLNKLNLWRILLHQERFRYMKLISCGGCIWSNWNVVFEYWIPTKTAFQSKQSSHIILKKNQRSWQQRRNRR